MEDIGNRDIMGQNIQFYLDRRGMTKTDLCRALDFKFSTVANWIKGNSYPRIEAIEKMANYFGIDKKDLVEQRVEQTPATGIIMEKIRNMKEDAVQRLMKYLDIYSLPDDSLEIARAFSVAEHPIQLAVAKLLDVDLMAFSEKPNNLLPPPSKKSLISA